MKNFFNFLAFLVSVAISCTGCATLYFSDYEGIYNKSQAPERAIILRDGSIVVDFSQNVGQEYYYKRLYFQPDDFAPDAKQSTAKDAMEKRIFQYVKNANADHEKGYWTRLDTRVLPLVPEQDSNNRTCMDFRNEIYNTNTSQGTRRALPGIQPFEICNESRRTVFRSDVAYDREVKRSWLFYPAQLLYVPIIVFDVVTFPVQLVGLIYVMNNLP